MRTVYNVSLSPSPIMIARACYVIVTKVLRNGPNYLPIFHAFILYHLFPGYTSSGVIVYVLSHWIFVVGTRQRHKTPTLPL